MVSPEIAQAFFTMVLNTGLALVVGGITSSLLLPNVRNQNWWIQLRLASAMKFGIFVCIAGTILSLWQTSATMGDVPLFESGPTLWQPFLTTHYGTVGLFAVGLLIVSAFAVLGMGKGQPTKMPFIIGIVSLALFAMCRVSVSHAFESGLWSIAVLVELSHLVLMSIWVGLVLTAGWIVLPGLHVTKAGQDDTKMYLSSVSSWATFALVGILASGVFNAFRVLTTPHDLVASQYGWTLTTKIALVLTAILLGGWNRFFGFPKAYASFEKTESGIGSLRAATLILRIESVALIGVLVIAAVLTGSAPPASI